MDNLIISIQNLGNMLSTKLETLKKSIEEVVRGNANDQKKVMKSLENTADAIDSFPKKITKSFESLSDDQRDIVRILQKITNQLTNIGDSNISNKDISQIEDSIKNITVKGQDLSPLITAIKNIDIKSQRIDFTEVVSYLSEISGKIVNAKDYSEELTLVKQSLNEINKSLKELSKKKEIKVEIPKTFKLDDMQLRSLRTQGASGYSGPIPARSSIITRVSMTSANTEYSHTFNKGTVSWRMKLEATNASFNYSWTTGKLKVSGDATGYISIPASWLDSRDNAEYGGKTIYFESGTASMTMEIEEGIA